MTAHTARPASGRLSKIREVLAHRAVFRELVARDLKLRYEGAVLGWAWTVFEPLLLTVVYAVVFSVIARLDVDDYPVFLIVGILPWQWFNATITVGTRSIRRHRGLLSKVYLPRELAPLTVVGAKSVEYLATVPVLAAVAAVFLHPPGWQIVFMPLGWLIQLTLISGLALTLAPFNAIATDFERLLSPLLRAGFYLTPVLYPLESVIDRFWPGVHYLFALNPMVGPIELYRYGFYPELFAGWGWVAASAAIAAVSLLVGLTVFSRLEHTVLKEL